tara:strand:- start:227 stop:601 length:375 start_codon:yes stop_codon:yes gene_type:complete
MINCIKHRLKNLLSFSDKAGRLDYIVVQLCTIGAFVIPMLVSINANINLLSPLQYLLNLIPYPQGFSIGAYQVLLLVCIIVIFVNSIQRINDIGKSRWLSLCLFIPLIGQLFILYLAFAPTKNK